MKKRRFIKALFSSARMRLALRPRGCRHPRDTIAFERPRRAQANKAVVTKMSFPHHTIATIIGFNTCS
jgi:hypothetical protein